MHDYPPPRRRAIRHPGHEDAPSKIRRLVVREEGRRRYEERPFDPEAPRERYAQPHHFAVNRDKRRSSPHPANSRRPADEYYVWEMSAKGTPVRLVTKKPIDYRAAKQLARIGATEGKHDRAVTTSPMRKSFRLVDQYERGTGRKLT